MLRASQVSGHNPLPALMIAASSTMLLAVARAVLRPY